MKKRYMFLFATLLLLIVANQIVAQVPVLQWQKTFGTARINDGFSTQQTRDGGFVVAGQTGNGLDDFMVIKLGASGNVQWQYTYGGSGSESAYSIEQTSDGGYIVAGEASSTDGQVTGNHGGFDMWVVKLDSLGNLTWEKSLGGSGNDFATSVQQTDDGGYIVAGASASNDGDVTGNHGGTDDWIVKLDAKGNITWEKSYGGSNLDQANSVRQTKDGGYIVAGLSASRNGNVTGVRDTVYGDFWILKLNKNGGLTWEKTYGGSDYDDANSVRQTIDGGYVAAGWTRSTNGNVTGNHGGYDYWVVKLDTSGNLSWQKAYGGSSDDLAYSVEQTSDGGYVVAGGSTSNNDNVSGNHGAEDFWIVKTDGSGSLQWQLPLGGSEYEEARSIDQSTDGGFIITGFTNSTDGQVAGNNSSNYSFWVTKLGSQSLSCGTPGNLAAASITSTSAAITWNGVSGANTYNLRYKTAAASSWTTVSNLTSTDYDFNTLSACTTYKLQVQSVCTGNPGAFSDTLTFITTGCAQNYCTSEGTNTTHGYINKVSIETINNTSGNNGGYGNFTNLSANLLQGASYTIQLTPGFVQGAAFTEYWTVYIDFNEDGIFESNELVAKGHAAIKINKSFTVPATAILGPTRMRIQMQAGALETNSCATYTYGEVEDYTVNVTTNGGLAAKTDDNNLADVAEEGSPAINDLKLYPNPAQNYLLVSFISTGSSKANLNICNLLGEKINSVEYDVASGSNSFRLNTDALSSGVYIFEIDYIGNVQRVKFIIAH